ncbi:MAG: hypothetical protein RML49_05740 [Verrucomicrobiae bacterium]|nr:hypothetical protein [Verrucomicrobiae bacterium]
MRSSLSQRPDNSNPSPETISPTDFISPEGRQNWIHQLLALRPNDLHTFTALLARLLTWQTHCLPHLQSWLKRYATNATTPTPRTWRSLPAIPQSLYKEITLYAPPSPPALTFHTSGTTEHRRGTVHLLSSDVYQALCTAHAQRIGLLDPAPHAIFALLPCPEEAPHSSLSWMIRFWIEALPASSRAKSQWFVHNDQLHLLEFARCLQRWNEKPLLLVGTAFAWVHFIDYAEARSFKIRLHPRTQIVETGGYKGRSRELRQADLYAHLSRILGIPPDQIWNEYGMTELTSQSYARGLSSPHQPAPWLRYVIVDPITFRPVKKGSRGLIKAIDLGNVDTPCLLLTADQAIAEADGQIRLLGRAPLADDGRGCSLPAETFSLVS